MGKEWSHEMRLARSLIGALAAGQTMSVGVTVSVSPGVRELTGNSHIDFFCLCVLSFACFVFLWLAHSLCTVLLVSDFYFSAASLCGCWIALAASG